MPGTDLEPARAPEPQTIDLVKIASDPNIPVEKLERLMAMQERLLTRASEEAFNAAMSAVQAQLRSVAPDLANPQTKSKYASYAAIDRVVRPVYTAHGFGLSFDTGDASIPEFLRILCYVTHRNGHARTYHVDMPNDGKGARGGDVMTKTHATGAAMSYGMRYLLKMIFNVAIGEDDRDGNEVAAPPVAPAPEGFDEWLLDLDAVASHGTTDLEAAWKQSKPEYKRYLLGTGRQTWETIKARAARVKTDA